MLPTDERLHTPAAFSAVVKRGRRAGTPTLVVHLLTRPDFPVRSRVGFVVSGKVGNSVVRHRITRRLRPLVRERLGLLPGGTDLVVRALPAAAGSTSSRFDRDLTDGLRTAARRAGVDLAGPGASPRERTP